MSGSEAASFTRPMSILLIFSHVGLEARRLGQPRWLTSDAVDDCGLC